MRTLVYFMLFFASLGAYAQVGISTETPDAAAELDVVSVNNNTGVLVPIFTDSAIVSTLNANQPPHGTLIYNNDRRKFMYNAGDGTTPLWSYIGAIPVVDNIVNITTAIEGDIRYCATNNMIYYYNGTAWKSLQ